jgi:flagellar basal-body rod modification protein FlgD
MSNALSSIGLSTTPSATGTSSSVMGKDDFLKLLVKQLQNQDPMNPMDGTQFASQLAQFSSVEQLSNINTTLTQSVSSNQLLSQSISNSLAASIIGKDIRASGDAFNYAGSGGQQLGYTLSSAADTVSVGIYDTAGKLVRTLKGSGVSAGDNTFTWDGKNDLGNSVASGKYTLKVTAKDSKGASITSSSYIFGNVSAVRYKANGAVFVVDGTEIPLSDVLEIMQG